ncbi:serine protease snake-like [Pseudomyrmex gracilis]|uniref:serine protease snake-like n=1 Tax=Pseudomyrmex gracilis TaxID=219809 RepID=UPI000995DB41|nr:serine protease snake-like [Pseudomyrmex gracilis]
MHGSIVIALLIAIFFGNSASRKCEEKCKEYADLVYETENVPTLRLNAGSKRISRCTIVETPLIVGGVAAKPAEFPHMAVIGYGKDGDISWQCGGSVISESFVLTAAHCMESPDRGPAAKVRVGLNDLTTPDETMQERDIAERIQHPDYVFTIRYHDIALLKLDRPLEFNSRVRPACLEVNFQVPGKIAIASGFGKTSYDSNKGSNELMKVQLNYIPEDDCKEGYAEDIGTKPLPQGLISSLLCAGIMEGGKDTCQGDSGGPLQRVLEDPYCMYSIVGVTSFGKFCAFKSMPAIYTRVQSYLDWIENIVWP